METMPIGNLIKLGILPENDCPLMKQPDNPQIRYQALHHLFLASAEAVLAARETDSENKVGYMLGTGVFYPLTCKPAVVLKASLDTDITNYLCGDIQIRGAYPFFAANYFRKLGCPLHGVPAKKRI